MNQRFKLLFNYFLFNDKTIIKKSYNHFFIIDTFNNKFVIQICNVDKIQFGIQSRSIYFLNHNNVREQHIRTYLIDINDRYIFNRGIRAYQSILDEGDITLLEVIKIINKDYNIKQIEFLTERTILTYE